MKCKNKITISNSEAHSYKKVDPEGRKHKNVKFPTEITTHTKIELHYYFEEETIYNNYN